MLAGLAYYHEMLGIRVVDAIVEEIRVGMEINQADMNQRRVSAVKYLGELYNYRMVTSKVIFHTLYTLITYPGDAPDNYFRVKLVTTLLDACGQFFDRGKDAKRLDCFLTYLQRYYLGKVQPAPIDVDMNYRDMLELLRPTLVLCETLEQAHAAVLVSQNNLKEGGGGEFIFK